MDRPADMEPDAVVDKAVDMEVDTVVDTMVDNTVEVDIAAVDRRDTSSTAVTAACTDRAWAYSSAVVSACTRAAAGRVYRRTKVDRVEVDTEVVDRGPAAGTLKDMDTTEVTGTGMGTVAACSTAASACSRSAPACRVSHSTGSCNTDWSSSASCSKDLYRSRCNRPPMTAPTSSPYNTHALTCGRFSLHY